MRYFLLLLLSTFLLSCSSTRQATETGQSHQFWLGTYTDGPSEGIYRWELSAAGTLRPIGLAGTSTNPSYLAYSANKNYIVAVNETDVDGAGGVQSFRIKDNTLELIDTRSSGGAHPCHIATSAQGDVVVSNYTGGNVGYLQMNASGSLSDLLTVQDHSGSADEIAHAHATYFSPVSDAVISVDLGTNDLWLSTVSNDQLQFSNPKTVALNDKAGPRHLAFHPNGKWLYIINEYANTVTLVEQQSNDAFAKRASYSTLPAGFKGESFCADIHVSKDGKFLYGSNRGANTIVAFSIDATSGALTQIDQESVHGDWPRNFSLSPDERYLVVANQRSNNLVTMRRDAKKGTLEYVYEVSAPSPVCVLF